MNADNIKFLCGAIAVAVLIAAFVYVWMLREEKSGDVWHETEMANTCPPPAAGHRCTKCGGCPLVRRKQRHAPLDGTFNSRGW